MYFSVITMLTVGYGDVAPCTTIERLFSIISIILTCGVFAYCMNVIGSIIHNLEEKNIELQ